MAEATEELADQLPKLIFVQLSSGYLYALDATEQAMREAHGKKAESAVGGGSRRGPFCEASLPHRSVAAFACSLQAVVFPSIREPVILLHD
jgi:hypothetical protein